MQHPTSRLSLLWGIMALFKSPKETHVKPTTWNTLILWLLDSNIIGLIKRNSWSSMVSSPTLRPTLDSLSVGPKDQKLPVVCYGLNVYYKWSPHYVILSLLKGKTVLPTSLLVPEAASLFPQASPSCPDLTNSPWSFISSKIMDFNTVHAANSWVKA